MKRPSTCITGTPATVPQETGSGNNSVVMIRTDASDVMSCSNDNDNANRTMMTRMPNKKRRLSMTTSSRQILKADPVDDESVALSQDVVAASTTSPRITPAAARPTTRKQSLLRSPSSSSDATTTRQLLPTPASDGLGAGAIGCDSNGSSSSNSSSRKSSTARTSQHHHVRFADQLERVHYIEPVAGEDDKQRLFYSNIDVARFTCRERKRQQVGHLTIALYKEQMQRVMSGRVAPIPTNKIALLYHKVCSSTIQATAPTSTSTTTTAAAAASSTDDRTSTIQQSATSSASPRNAATKVDANKESATTNKAASIDRMPTSTWTPGPSFGGRRVFVPRAA